MSKKDKKLEYRLIEVVEVLSESDKSSWAKVLAKISWNNKPATMDIRTINMDTIDDEDVSFGKGISLDDESMQRLAKKLLELGYLDIDELEEYIEEQNSIFKKKKKHKVKIIRNGD